MIKIKSIAQLALISIMMIAAAPAFSAPAMQMWTCEMDDDATEAEVTAGASKWLAAARKLDGGSKIEAYVNFPIAVNATDEADVLFVVTTPSFADWGKFWDAYGGSEAAKIDKANEEFAVCPDSTVWESNKVK